ncbi:hypothetical protein [Natronorubrum sp. FCH18a]|uniref:hypothetical protein n=1 Tax=Natronorubrum sp. FCH18a TaxID=3447018 RepID=UPI003F516D6A
MSTDQAGLSLRFRAGRFEEQLLYLILILQLTLGAMLVVITVGWLFFSLNHLSLSAQSVLYLFGVIPILIGLAAPLYFLTYLYE